MNNLDEIKCITDAKLALKAKTPNSMLNKTRGKTPSTKSNTRKDGDSEKSHYDRDLCPLEVEEEKNPEIQINQI